MKWHGDPSGDRRPSSDREPVLRCPKCGRQIAESEIEGTLRLVQSRPGRVSGVTRHPAIVVCPICRETVSYTHLRAHET